MICPKCGKKLPDNAPKCNKCGEIFKEIKNNNETEEFLKKEKAAEKAKKLSEKKEKSAKNKKILKIIIPCVALILVVAILAAVLITDRNKKKQEEIKKNTPELLIEYTMPETAKENAVITLGDINIGAEEYEFFYRQSFSNIQNSAMLAFKQFVSGKLGEDYNENLINDYYNEYFDEFSKEYPNLYDFNKPVNQQKHDVVDADGNTISWQEYIRNDAINTMTGYRIKYALAQKAGMTLTDDIRYQVYTHIEGLRDAISGSGYQNLNQYLQILFGSACNEEFFKNELIREYTASKYDSVNSIEKINSYSDKEIKDFYNKNRADFDYIDLCVYEVTGKGAEETAEEIAKVVKDVQDFSSAIKKYQNESADKTDLPQVPKQYVDVTYSKELGKWAYDADRKIGDKNVFETQNGYIVAVIQKPAYTTQNSISYREIVINKTDENGNPVSEEKLSEKKALAQQIYSEWKEKGASEDSFSYYAIKNSQGSTASDGGLVTFAAADTLNSSIKDWLTDSARKTGDAEMFETDGNFSIIYFIKNYGDYWNYAIRAQKAGETAADDFEAQKEKYAVKYDITDIESTEQQFLKNIDSIYFGIQ